MMKKAALYVWLGMAFFTAVCFIDIQEDIDDMGNVVAIRFKEGIIVMGMYSHGIDIGHYIKNIDFSRGDAKEQMEALIAAAEPDENLLSHFQPLSEQSPLSGLVLMFN